MNGITGSVKTCIHHFHTHTKHGLLKWGQKTSQIMRDAYIIDGMEKINLFTSALLKTIALNSQQCEKSFDPLLETLKAQKNIIYVIKIFSSPANYFTKVNSNYVFGLPQRKEYDQIKPQVRSFKTIDFGKILMDIGNVFDVGKFAQNMQIYSFPQLQRLATSIGNTRIAYLNIRFEQIPILNSICDRPKELFAFTAAVIDLGIWITAAIKSIKHKNNVNVKNPSLSLTNYLKALSCVGRMALIIGGRYCKNIRVLTTVIELPTRTIGLVKFFMDREMGRQQRYLYPGL